MARPDPRKALRKAAEQRKWSNVQLAEKLGLTPGGVSHLLSGHSKPSLGVAVCIEELLGIPVAHWVDP